MMVFKCPGATAWDGMTFDYQIIPEGPIPEGWFKTVFEANDALIPKEPAEDSPPTRAELEEKASELGIKFDGRTSDKRLADAIEQALK